MEHLLSLKNKSLNNNKSKLIIDKINPYFTLIRIYSRIIRS